MIAKLTQHWWVVALRGLVSILFGVAAFVIPGVTLVLLIAFVGAYLFVDGVFSIAQAIRLRHDREVWPSLILEGIAGIVIGIATYAWPGLTAVAWLYTIAAWAVITGLFEIVAAIRLRQEIANEWLLGLTGVASIAFGVLLAMRPLAGMIATVWLFGAYAIFFGAILVALGFRLRGLRSAITGAAGGRFSTSH